jgi:hypothetical protein
MTFLKPAKSAFFLSQAREPLRNFTTQTDISQWLLFFLTFRLSLLLAFMPGSTEPKSKRRKTSLSNAPPSSVTNLPPSLPVEMAQESTAAPALRFET